MECATCGKAMDLLQPRDRPALVGGARPTGSPRWVCTNPGCAASRAT
ncbi:MAG: hypothetical protein LC624_09080 [Halobacteriales archaeon]|nr:hypothetical protein [Halobacteriales archaeon]